MDIRTAGVAVFLGSAIASTEAAGLGGISDPRYCYALDVVLLLYCVFITALLLREKFCKPKASPQDSLYSDLGPHGDPYQQLRRDNDLETGAARANHRQTGDEVYTRLQKPDIDTYNQLQVKPERRRNKGEQVYQGLNTVTKDTYESLKMQPMPRPR